MAQPNTLRWSGSPGHYEVYYVTTTDPASGVGLWIRYTLVAPVDGAPATASLWFLAMDPRDGTRGVYGAKETFPITALEAQSDPFRLRIAESVLTDGGMSGGFGDARWDLRWSPGRAYAHVHPLLRPVASTVLVLPHADVAIDGHVEFGGRRLELSGARGGQAHLWGRKHANRWAWVHCNDFVTADGAPAPDAFVDGVSVFVSRVGREVGPATPFVGRVGGSDFVSRSGIRVLANTSAFSPKRWHFEVEAGSRKLVGDVEADADLLAGVTYTDPDGDLAYCYNTEAATVTVEVHERAGRRGWRHTATLLAPGRAHFEYAQRSPLAGQELHTT